MAHVFWRPLPARLLTGMPMAAATPGDGAPSPPIPLHLSCLSTCSLFFIIPRPSTHLLPSPLLSSPPRSLNPLSLPPSLPPHPTHLLQADDGHLYPLERAFFYVQKPPTLLVYDEVDSVEFMRQSSGVTGQTVPPDRVWRWGVLSQAVWALGCWVGWQPKHGAGAGEATPGPGAVSGGCPARIPTRSPIAPPRALPAWPPPQPPRPLTWRCACGAGRTSSSAASRATSGATSSSSSRPSSCALKTSRRRSGGLAPRP